MATSSPTPRAVLIAAAIAISAVYGSAFSWSPVEDGPVLCLLRAGTGVPCPLCGMSRAFIMASHGDVWGAFTLHPLFPILYVGGLVLLAAIVGELCGARFTTKTLGRPLRVVLWVTAIFAVFWVLRVAWLWHTGELAIRFLASLIGRLFGG